jgi:hypothetical protein
VARFSEGPSNISEEEYRQADRREMARGAFFCIGGLIVTVLTYAGAVSSPRGGTYTIAWGAVVFGAWHFFHGLMGYIKN